MSRYNWRNFWICFLVSLGQVAFGYPSSIIGTTLGEPSFLEYMTIIDPKTGESTPRGDQLQGAMSGVFQAGAVVGVLAVSWVMDRFGRKAAMGYCIFFSLFGGAWLCGAPNVGNFIAARFFTGVGSWGFLAVSMLLWTALAMPVRYLPNHHSTSLLCGAGTT
jgi:MFS family permease